MAEQVPQDFRLLKAVVIGLGLAIIAGFGLLIWGLVSQGNHIGHATMAPVVIPEGASVTQMALSDRMLALKVEGQGGEEILLVDMKSGAVLRRVPIEHRK
jgi:hypothetical protein